MGVATAVEVEQQASPEMPAQRWGQPCRFRQRARAAPASSGAGPFSQRVLLTLEEKKVPYKMKLVDLGNKPEWSVRLSPSVLFPPLIFPQEHSAVLHAVSHNRLAKRRSRRVFFF